MNIFGLFGRKTANVAEKSKEIIDEIIPPAEENDDEEELIAVIAAVVAAVMKKPVSGFRVVSFKRRGNWR